MVLVSFSSKELVRKLDERRAAEDSYCSFEALELGCAALQSDRTGLKSASTGFMAALRSACGPRTIASMASICSRERLSDFAHECSSLWWSAATPYRHGDTGRPLENVPANLRSSRGAPT